MGIRTEGRIVICREFRVGVANSLPGIHHNTVIQDSIKEIEKANRI